MLVLGATDTGPGVCRLALAAALSVSTTDARMPERQTRYVSICHPGFRGQVSARAIDARARLSGVHRTRLSA
jgi:hypothetical protein